MNPPKEIIKIGQLEVRLLLDEKDTDDQMVVFEFIIPPGAKVPVAHYHVEADELVYGLEGTTTSYVNGHKIEIGPGDRYFIPRGAIHYHDNHTNENAKSLCILSPASIKSSYFREISELFKAAGPPDTTKLMEIMGRHGLVPAK